MKMKYECPVSSKMGKDLPLWKTATRCFLECVGVAVPNLKRGWCQFFFSFAFFQTFFFLFFSNILSLFFSNILFFSFFLLSFSFPTFLTFFLVMTHDRLARIWRRVLDCFKGAILADW